MDTDASYFSNICEYKLAKTEIFILAAFLIFKLVPFSIIWYPCTHIIIFVVWSHDLNWIKHIWKSANNTSACTSEAEYHIYVLPASLWTVKTAQFRLYWIILVTIVLERPYTTWEPGETFQQPVAPSHCPRVSRARGSIQRKKTFTRKNLWKLHIIVTFCVICVYLHS